jgi:septal ring factor EnvC (AmiA/AmiB activator)
MASFDEATFAAVFDLLKVAADPKRAAEQLAKIQAALGELAAAGAALAKERAAFDQHIAKREGEIERKMEALAHRLTAANDLDRRHDALAEMAARLKASGMHVDPNLTGTLTRG